MSLSLYRVFWGNGSGGMGMPEIVSAQRTDEWYAARLGKITASVAAACLGLDPYKSRQKAYREIMGTEPPEQGNRAMEWGLRYESAARLDYEVETGNIVVPCGFFVHPNLEWLGASPDGLIGDDGLCEIKCPQQAQSYVPIHHRIQMLVQLAVTGRTWAEYFSWGADGGRFRQIVCRSGIVGIVLRLKTFYERYVVPGVEPERKRPGHSVLPPKWAA